MFPKYEYLSQTSTSLGNQRVIKVTNRNLSRTSSSFPADRRWHMFVVNKSTICSIFNAMLLVEALQLIEWQITGILPPDTDH